MNALLNVDLYFFCFKMYCIFKLFYNLKKKNWREPSEIFLQTSVYLHNHLYICTLSDPTGKTVSQNTVTCSSIWVPALSADEKYISTNAKCNENEYTTDYIHTAI